MTHCTLCGGTGHNASHCPWVQSRLATESPQQFNRGLKTSACFVTVAPRIGIDRAAPIVLRHRQD